MSSFIMYLLTATAAWSCTAMDGGFRRGVSSRWDFVWCYANEMDVRLTSTLTQIPFQGSNAANNECLILQLLLWSAAARGVRLQEGGGGGDGEREFNGAVGSDGVRRVREGDRPRLRVNAWGRLVDWFRSGALKRRANSFSAGAGTGDGEANGRGAILGPGIYEWWEDIFLPPTCYPPVVIQDYFSPVKEYCRSFGRTASRNSGARSHSPVICDSCRNWNKRSAMAAARVKLLAQVSL